MLDCHALFLAGFISADEKLVRMNIGYKMKELEDIWIKDY